MATMEARWQGATDPAVIAAHYPRLKGVLAFDIGANIGQIAHVLAPNFGTVISVEPCAESFKILQDEAPENVTCLDCAISDHAGTVTLMEAEQSIKSGQLVTKEGLHWGPIVGSRDIPCRTLDSLAGEYGTPDFVKIDTEGHELPIVLGAEKVLRSGCRWLVEIHHLDAGERIAGIFEEYDYQTERIGYASRPGSVLAHHSWIKAWGA